ncbi:MAG: VanZ family protein [Betaproteobacteria bacterium]|nr:VanZ family protein [Betaproteobacteria bacterium]
MKLLLRYMPQVFFLGLALVTILSLMPNTSIPQAFQFWDKAQHSLAYVALSITGCLAFPQWVTRVLLGLLTHGAAIEIMQSTMTATRYGDVQDWLADGIGILVGLGLCRYGLPKSAAKPDDAH